MKIILPWQIARVIFWVEWNSWRTACASRNPPTRTLQMTSSPTSFLIIVIQYNIMMNTFVNSNHSRLSTSSVWEDVSMEVSVSLSGHYPRHLCRNICYRSLSKSSIIIIIITRPRPAFGRLGLGGSSGGYSSSKWTSRRSLFRHIQRYAELLLYINHHCLYHHQHCHHHHQCNNPHHHLQGFLGTWAAFLSIQPTSKA